MEELWEMHLWPERNVGFRWGKSSKCLTADPTAILEPLEGTKLEHWCVRRYQLRNVCLIARRLCLRP